MEFIGREEELNLLEEQYALDHSFVILKGRRRVGKSRLIEEFLKDKTHLYFEVNRETSSSILSSLLPSLCRLYELSDNEANSIGMERTITRLCFLYSTR